MPLQQLDGQPGSSTAIQLATQCLELALSGCIKIKSETKEGRKGRRSPMQADGWRDGSTRAVGAALYVQLHSSCSLPQALAAAAACRMRPHKPSRAAAHCRSSMTTAWQAMERFSPSESTFSCVLALMFTTLRATRGRDGCNGGSAVQSNRFLSHHCRARRCSSTHCAAARCDIAGRNRPVCLSNYLKCPGFSAFCTGLTWGARPASGTGCPESPPCAATSWAAAAEKTRCAQRERSVQLGASSSRGKPRKTHREATEQQR